MSSRDRTWLALCGLLPLLVWSVGWFGVASPFPYRVAAVVLHSLNAVLLALWLLGLGLDKTRALVAAALWSVMPIHAESVYWEGAFGGMIASTALLAALALATWPSLLARLGAVGLWTAALFPQPTAVLGAVALLYTMAVSPPSNDDADAGAEATRPPLGVPAVAGGAAFAIWWTARELSGVELPSNLPLDWSALAASFGEAIVRAVGLGEQLRAGGPPLHGVSIVAGIALVATGWYSWRGSRQYPHVALSVLSLSLIGIAQALIGQSRGEFVLDPDHYFYLTSAVVPVMAVCAWTPAERSSGKLDMAAAAGVTALLLFWSWSAISARASYDDFESMLTREIRIGRASAKVYQLRGMERMDRKDPCVAEMDFRSSFALARSDSARAQARELGLEALHACSDEKAEAPASKPEAP